MLSLLGKLLKARTPSPPAPDSFDRLRAEAASAAKSGDLHGAIRLYDRAIAIEPGQAEPYYKRANALKDIGRLEAAVADYDRAIERNPDYAYAYCNRGVVQQRLGLTDAALSSYDRAVTLAPGDAVTHCNRALLLQDCSRWDEALASYDRALAIDPQFSDAQYNRALTALFLGDFPNGWRGFEWRWRNAQRLSIGAPRHLDHQLWLGADPLAGKTLLLYSEGGLGDTLQFCRYAALGAAAGATVLLEVQPPLTELLGGLAGVAGVIAEGGALPRFDYQCPLMSAPLAFHTTLGTIPAPQGYLCADPARVAQWRTRLGERKRPRVGLVWSGNPRNFIDQRRSIRLAEWAPQLPAEFEYFRLQKGVREEDRGALDSTPMIRSFPDDSLDFADTAALCECMDLVISVDTSIAHLSGALGRRTWALLSFLPDWRWLQDRSDCPWYPTMTLYRQASAGEWGAVFNRVREDLRREFPVR
jgi:Flp pilus assembly protein TadD